MIDQVIMEALGQIAPSQSYSDHQKMLLSEQNIDPRNNLIYLISKDIRLGITHLYLGQLSNADKYFTNSITTIQISFDTHISNSDKIKELYICALIGRYMLANISRDIDVAEQFLNRAETLLAELNNNEDSPLSLFVTLFKGSYLSFNGDNSKANLIFVNAIEKTKRSDDRAVYLVIGSSLLTHLSVSYLRTKSLNSALELLREAFVLAKQVKFVYGEAEALRRIAIIYSENNEQEKAVNLFNDVYEQYDAICNPLGIVNSLISLGKNYSSYERKHAEFCFKRAIEISKQCGFNSELAQLYSRLGDIHMSDGRFDVAEKLYEKDFILTRKSNSSRRKAHAFRNLGRIQHIQNKLTPAIENLTESLKIFESVGDKTNSSLVALRLCQCKIEKGSIDEAKALEKRARETFGITEGKYSALCDMMSGMIYRSEGFCEAAHEYLTNSKSVLEKYGNSFAKIRCMLELSFTYKDLRAYDSYINELKNVIRLARHSRIGDLEEKALELLREADEQEWLRMKNVVFIGVASDKPESKIIGATIMFVDIRNYTVLSENVDVKQLADFINDFFDVVSRIIYANGGVVNKYIGDCVMCLFGIETDVMDVADGHHAAFAACKSAIDIHESAILLRQRYSFTNSFSFGIGIASGPVVAGYFGGRERLEFSTIGSTVNLASRLQSKADKNKAIICSKTAELIGDSIRITLHDDVECKGFATPVKVKALEYESQNKRLH